MAAKTLLEGIKAVEAAREEMRQPSFMAGLFAGGGLRLGQVVGSSDAKGAYVTDRPFSPEDVAATVYHHLGIDGPNTALPDHSGRPYYLVEKGQPIRELIGDA